jgi:hypothetical protein
LEAADENDAVEVSGFPSRSAVEAVRAAAQAATAQLCAKAMAACEAEMAALQEASNSKADAAYQKGRAEALEAQHAKDEFHWARCCKQTSDAAFLRGVKETMEEERTQKERMFERSLKQAERATTTLIDQTNREQDHSTSQMKLLINYSLLQGGHATLGLTGPSNQALGAPPKSSLAKKELLQALLEECDLEERSEAMWQYGIRSAAMVGFMKESDRAALNISEFSFARLQEAASKAHASLQAPDLSTALDRDLSP